MRRLTSSILRRLYVNQSRPPSASDDSAVGMVPGQRWIDTSASPAEEYVCLGNQVGAAKWEKTTSGAHGNAGYQINVRNFGAKGDGVTDDIAAFEAAIAAAKVVGVQTRFSGDPYTDADQVGVPIFVPSGRYIVSRPIVFPRSGNYRSNCVGLVGESKNNTSIVAHSTLFPAGRAIIEWEQGASAVGRRVRSQVFTDLSFVPKNEVGAKIMWFYPTSPYTNFATINTECMYDLRLERIICYGSNQYHAVSIRLEGRVDYSQFNDITGDYVQGTAPTYSTALLQFDRNTVGLGGDTYGRAYDYQGANFCYITNLYTGMRGGYMTMLKGRFNGSILQNGQSGQGALGTASCFHIQDSTCFLIENVNCEGRAEDGIITLENCTGGVLRNLQLGVTERTLGDPSGSGIRLINCRYCIIENRTTESGPQGFSYYLDSKLIKVDALSRDCVFRNILGNRPFANEVQVDPAAQRISIHYTDVTTQTVTNFGDTKADRVTSLGGITFTRDITDGYSTDSNVTGAIRVLFPAGYSGAHVKIQLTIHTGDNNNSSYCNLLVAGTPLPAGSWTDVTVAAVGSMPTDMIRLGDDGAGKVCLVLGDTSTVWSTPSIAITDVQASLADTSSWGSGYAINLLTDLTGYNLAYRGSTNTVRAFANGRLHRYDAVAALYLTATTTGTVKITLPTTWDNTQHSLRLEGMDWAATTRRWTCLIAGYTNGSGSAWAFQNAQWFGRAPFQQIRLAHDGTRACILLGTTATTWTSTKMLLTELFTAYLKSDQQGSGWTIGVITDETGITVSQTINLPAATAQEALTYSEGTRSQTIASIPFPADTPATADALRDDLVANTIPAMRNAIKSLVDMNNAMRQVLVDAGLMKGSA